MKAQFDKIFDFDFLLSVKNNSTINFYIPKRQRANVIGQGGGAIQKLESDLGMRISVKGFSDLPLMETSVRTDKSRNDARIVLSFEQMADQKIYLLVDNEILPYRVDKRGRIVIT